MRKSGFLIAYGDVMKKFRVALWIVICLVFLLGLLYLFTGSLETFPAPEQQQKAGITALVIMVVPAICGVVMLLTRKKKAPTPPIPPLPPLSEIVEEMYDKCLSYSENYQAIKTIYSEDKTKRYVLLKSVNGYYKYTYEELYVCEQEELRYVYSAEDRYPAWWIPKDNCSSASFFGTEKEALSALIQDAEYKQYFVKE